MYKPAADPAHRMLRMSHRHESGAAARLTAVRRWRGLRCPYTVATSCADSARLSCAGVSGRITSTGTGLCSTNAELVLPSRNELTRPRPRDPRTTRS